MNDKVKNFQIYIDSEIAKALQKEESSPDRNPVESRVHSLETELCKVKADLEEVKIAADDLEQHGRRETLEFHNITILLHHVPQLQDVLCHLLCRQPNHMLIFSLLQYPFDL